MKIVIRDYQRRIRNVNGVETVAHAIAAVRKWRTVRHPNGHAMPTIEVDGEVVWGYAFFAFDMTPNRIDAHEGESAREALRFTYNEATNTVMEITPEIEEAWRQARAKNATWRQAQRDAAKELARTEYRAEVST
jgi:hypothetical protein